MLRIAAKPVVALMEDEFVRGYVAFVYHVAYSVSEEIPSGLLLTMLLDMESTITGPICGSCPLPTAVLLLGLLQFTHERMHPLLVLTELFDLFAVFHATTYS